MKRAEEVEEDGAIGGIENRRAIRETQRKDSITSHKESKPSGEINKRSPLPATKAVRGEEGRRDRRRREEKRREPKRTTAGVDDEGGESERERVAVICAIEIPDVRSILSSILE